MNEQKRLAAFVDAENLTQWLKLGGLETLLEDLSSIGLVVVRRAYANWTSPGVVAHQALLNRLGFELIHTYHPVSGKNSADIQIAVDVMEYAWRDDLSCIALATGDSDFSPLFRRLREMGKQVVGVGPRSALSESVKSSCSRFLYTHTETPSPTLDAESRESALDDATDLLETTLRTFDGPANCASLKNRMLAIDSAFDEKALGFRSFSDFVSAAEGVVLIQDGGTRQASLEPRESIRIQEIHGPAARLGERGADGLTDSYRRILRTKHWRTVPRSVLTTCFHTMQNLGTLPKSEMLEHVVRLCDGRIATTDVRKTYELLFKAGLIEPHDQKPSGEHIWEVTPASEAQMLHAVDKAMLTRLFSGPEEAPVPPDAIHVRPLLFADTNSQELDALLQEARMAYRGTNPLPSHSE